jgi:transketolase
MPTRKASAERMVELGETRKDFVVFEADIGSSTNSYLFNQVFPDRYFQMGIAELNMMSSAAGMAADGRPVVVAGYGVFLTMRALESVRTFICYPNLNVKLFSSHAGITAAIDGVSHQATEDIAFMGTLPNMKILVPADTNAARKCLDEVINIPGPAYLRLMRDSYFDLYDEAAEFPIGGSHQITEGNDITIVSYGDILFQAIQASEALKKEGIKAEVIDLYSVKPFDWDAVKRSIGKTGALIVAENHQKRNGLGYEIAYNLMKERISIPFEVLGLDDTFAETGNYNSLIEKYGISASAIQQLAKSLVGDKL